MYEPSPYDNRLTHPSIHPPTHPLTHLPTYPFIHPPTHPSLHPSTHQPIDLPPTHTDSIKCPAPVEWALTSVFSIELVLRYYVAEDRCSCSFFYIC